MQSAAFDEWNELLGRVKVQTQDVDSEIVELFYSSFYRTHISPADCKSCRGARLLLNFNFHMLQTLEKILIGIPLSHITTLSTVTCVIPLYSLGLELIELLSGTPSAHSIHSWPCMTQ